MDAVVSGSAGLAFISDGAGIWSLRRGPAGPERLPRRRHDIPALLGDAQDLAFLEDVDEAAVLHELDLAHAGIQAIQLALMLCDPATADTTVALAAGELDDLLSRAAVAERAERILEAKPMPAPFDPGKAVERCKANGVKRAVAFLDALASRQRAIREVRRAWEVLPSDLFSSGEDRAFTDGLLAREGLFRSLVRAHQVGASLDAWLAAARAEPAVIRTHVERCVEAWAASLRALAPQAGGASVSTVAVASDAGEVARFAPPPTGSKSSEHDGITTTTRPIPERLPGPIVADGKSGSEEDYREKLLTQLQRAGKAQGRYLYICYAMLVTLFSAWMWTVATHLDSRTLVMAGGFGVTTIAVLALAIRLRREVSSTSLLLALLEELDDNRVGQLVSVFEKRANLKLEQIATLVRKIEATQHRQAQEEQDKKGTSSPYRAQFEQLEEENQKKEGWLENQQHEIDFLRDELAKRPMVTRKSYRIFTLGMKGTGKTSLTLKWSNPLIDLGALQGTKVERYERTVSQVVTRDVTTEHVFEIGDWGGEHIVDAQQEIIADEIHGLLIVVDLGGKDAKTVEPARIEEQLREFQPEVLKYFFGPKTVASCKTVVLFINKSDLVPGTPAEAEAQAKRLYGRLIDDLMAYHARVDIRILVGSANYGHATHHLFSHFVEKILPKNAYDNQLLQRMKSDLATARSVARLGVKNG
jgi:hypothetical protein